MLHGLQIEDQGVEVFAGGVYLARDGSVLFDQASYSVGAFHGRHALFGPKNLIATLDRFEIGSTGPGTLQFVLRPKGHEVTTKLTAEEARWMAFALGHWADVSEGITTSDPYHTGTDD